VKIGRGGEKVSSDCSDLFLKSGRELGVIRELTSSSTREGDDP